jgi:putative transposase
MEDLPSSDFKIMKDHDCYYIILSLPYKKPSKLKKKYKVISLDPGTRCFQTGYDPQGTIINIGVKQIEQIKKLHKTIDYLKSKVINKRSKYNLKKKYTKLQKKVQNVVKDLHNQSCSMLSKNYNNILLPEFGTSKMVIKDLHSPVNRMMNTLSFYKFKEKMKLACYKNNSSLYIVTEEYTSKTCTNCGSLKTNLGGSKIYNCECCKVILDRDVNGARNILLKHIIKK